MYLPLKYTTFAVKFHYLYTEVLPQIRSIWLKQPGNRCPYLCGLIVGLDTGVVSAQFGDDINKSGGLGGR